MRRTVALLLHGAAAGRLRCDEADASRSSPRARPSRSGPSSAGARRYPATGQRLGFGVDTLVVRRTAGRSSFAVTNRHGDPVRARRQPALAFGLMLFDTGNLDELDRGEPRRQPARAAPRDDDAAAPPDVLAPGATWRATISAPGVARRRQLGPRRRSGPSSPVARPPEGMEPRRRLDHRPGRTGSEPATRDVPRGPTSAAKEEAMDDETHDPDATTRSSPSRTTSATPQRRRRRRRHGHDRRRRDA